MRKTLLVTAIVLILGSAVGVLVGPDLWRRFQVAHAISVLKNAETQDELENAVNLGIYQTYPNGEWIAIFYSDMHSPALGSVTVVRTSSDRWFQSDTHYCGGFVTYRNRAHPEFLSRFTPSQKSEWLNDLQSAFPTSEIHQILKPNNLNDTIEAMLRSEFVEFSVE